MSVNPDLRTARRADTEARVLQAASDLFVERGYAATTLTDVAARAGVGARTVYVRFGTKAAVLQRAVGVALAGDARPLAVDERDEFAATLTAPTAADRIALWARHARALFERAGALLAVSAQAESSEPVLALASQAGREHTRSLHRRFWTCLRDDGLLPADADLDWLVDTCTLLGSADTFVQMTKVIGWDLDAYERWLVTTWTRLAAAGTGPA